MMIIACDIKLPINEIIDFPNISDRAGKEHSIRALVVREATQEEFLNGQKDNENFTLEQLKKTRAYFAPYYYEIHTD